VWALEVVRELPFRKAIYMMVPTLPSAYERRRKSGATPGSEELVARSDCAVYRARVARRERRDRWALKRPPLLAHALTVDSTRVAPAGLDKASGRAGQEHVGTSLQAIRSSGSALRRTLAPRCY
jgi:hypothetical protein